MKKFIVGMLLAVAGISYAQNAVPYHPPGTPPPPHRVERNNWDYPRWCRQYSYRDYRREYRACGADRECRWRANRKAERCGLR